MLVVVVDWLVGCSLFWMISKEMNCTAAVTQVQLWWEPRRSLRLLCTMNSFLYQVSLANITHCCKCSEYLLDTSQLWTVVPISVMSAPPVVNHVWTLSVLKDAMCLDRLPLFWTDPAVKVCFGSCGGCKMIGNCYLLIRVGVRFGDLWLLSCTA